MALPTLYAEPLCNKHYPWRVVRTPDGWRGVQYWTANRSAVTAALAAPELPGLGDVYDGDAPSNLVLRAIESVYRGGGDNASAGRPGWVILELQFSTPDGQFGGAPERVAGTAWRSLGGGVEQVTQIWDIDLFEPSPTADMAIPINQGDGIPLDVGRIVHLVHVYMEHADFVAIEERLVELKRRQIVNNAAIDLPLLNGISGSDREVDTGKLRFHDFDTPTQRVDDGLVEVVITLIEADESHLYIESRRDETGNSTGSHITRRQYALGDLSGIWN